MNRSTSSPLLVPLSLEVVVFGFGCGA